MEGILPFILIILVLGGVIYFAVTYSKKVNARKIKLYEEFAFKNGLKHSINKQFFSSLNVVSGKLKGHDFTMYEIMQGSGKNRHLVTYTQFLNTDFNFDFRIGKEHFFSKTGKMLGMSDIEMGNDEFDKLFLLKSKNEQALRDLLNYKMQDELMSIKNALKSTITVKAGMITYSIYGGIQNENTMAANKQVIDFILKLMEKSDRW